MRQAHASTSSQPPTTTYPAILGRIVAEVRKDRGLGQAELAAGLGLTQSGLSRIERGDTAPTVEQLADIARVLELKSPGQLLALADQAVEDAEAQGIRVLMKRSDVSRDMRLVMIGALALGVLVLAVIATVLGRRKG